MWFLAKACSHFPQKLPPASMRHCMRKMLLKRATFYPFHEWCTWQCRLLELQQDPRVPVDGRTLIKLKTKKN